MTDIEKLRKLLERVESATAESLPDKTLTLALVAAFVPAIADFPHQADTFFGDDPLSSIDAAVALKDRVLPKMTLCLTWGFARPTAMLWKGQQPSINGDSLLMPNAICAAILRAKIAMLEKETE